MKHGAVIYLMRRESYLAVIVERVIVLCVTSLVLIVMEFISENEIQSINEWKLEIVEG